jgi:diacylglycerol kinase
MGLVVETLNTAIEQTLDCVSLDRRDDIMHAKDIAAAAMLVCACGACIIACFIYVPYLRHYLGL